MTDGRIHPSAGAVVTDGQTDRQTDRQTDGQTDRQTKHLYFTYMKRTQLTTVHFFDI